jgi:hypothetical protein
MRRGARDFVCNRNQALPFLQCRIHDRALVPEARRRVVITQLDGARQRPLRPHGVAPAQQHLAQEAIRFAVRGIELAGLDECGLGFPEEPSIEVHAPHRQHHRRVVAMPSLGGVSHFA